MPISPAFAGDLALHLPKELLAQQTYLAFSQSADMMGFFGCAAFFQHESQNERRHLETMLQFLTDFDITTPVPAAPLVNCQYDNVADLFEAALEMEQTVTKSLSQIAVKALQAGDVLAFTFLHPFLQEQITSEIEYRNILRRYDLGNLPEFDDWVKELA
jgi:ferritin